MTARRADDPQDVSLVIHGHFYQPPRENPWLETIEREPSAHPYPNWDARITDECYRTNGWARVFEAQGRVVDLVNNYASLSFNFGPTLLTWIEAHAPDTYQRILEADQASVRARSGHGNALAQAYSHAILPLCNDRDRRTLIRWGLKDFQARFGRDPESLWLPETAVDAPTVEALIDAGMRFLILSPRQAARVRRLGEAAWTDVSSSKIDPRQPYRLFSTRAPADWRSRHSALPTGLARVTISCTPWSGMSAVRASASTNPAYRSSMYSRLADSISV